jgi:hypothetical protein
MKSLGTNVTDLTVVDKLTIKVQHRARRIPLLPVAVIGAVLIFAVADGLVRTRLYWRIDLAALTAARPPGTGIGRQEVALLIAALVIGVLVGALLSSACKSAGRGALVTAGVCTVLTAGYWPWVAGRPHGGAGILWFSIPVAYATIARRQASTT